MEPKIYVAEGLFGIGYSATISYSKEGLVRPGRTLVMGFVGGIVGFRCGLGEARPHPGENILNGFGGLDEGLFQSFVFSVFTLFPSLDGFSLEPLCGFMGSAVLESVSLSGPGHWRSTDVPALLVSYKFLSAVKNIMAVESFFFVETILLKA